ncbi:MAG: cell wall metabolism sensor histidine kinase WalK [Ruminococcaceae bacterium]|nr:cell wall metabolism sensor histidine kinase WalK [Oscillospiraceae bacterium]
MYRGLYFKIILILVVFILIVMSVVGAVLISNVLAFYNEEFSSCMDQNFASDGQLRVYLENAMTNDSTAANAENQRTILEAYSSRLGIDDYRSYYILDKDGGFLAGSNAEGEKIALTPNIISAIGGNVGDAKNQSSDFADFALPLSNGSSQCIIYIRDTQEELSEVSWMLFSIILQALFIGLIIAFILSFFLARAISLPLSKLTEGVQRVSKGNFKEKIRVQSNDEIGVLTENFNHMSRMIEENLDEINGEREKLETVLSCLKDAVITFGEDGKPLQINDAARTLFEDNLANLSLDYMFSLLNYDRNDIDIDLGDNGAGVPAVHYNDRVYELYFGNIRYRDNEKMHEGIILVIHDVTQSYALDLSRREFVANASHELRTPLTTIKMVLETLAGDENITSNELTKSFLEMAETESTRMEALIKNLLTLSQIDSKTMSFDMKRICITESVASIAKTLSYTATSKEQSLTFDGTFDELYISGDRIRVEQTIINIVSNAIKYTQSGGEIHISLAEAGDNIEISVRDNGVGIPKEDLPRLFERFYRVEKARNSAAGGTGLGLAIAKEFALAHGGDITVESEVGVGTTFKIIFPKA